MTTVYYLQDGNHIFAVEQGKGKPTRVGMITPKRGKPPAFKKNVAVEIPAEKALKYVKTSAPKSVAEALAMPKSEPKPVVTSAVLKMSSSLPLVTVSPERLAVERSKVFNDILDFQKKSAELHKNVLGLVKAGIELKTLPENVKEVLKALYMGGNIEIKDPPKEIALGSADVKQFDENGTLTMSAPEKKPADKAVLRGKLY